MRENGHSRIDVLKMDIEGSEYPVIEDIVNGKIEIKQVLVEFHHRFEGIGVEKTNEAIKKLEAAGYDLFAVADNGEEMSFVKRNS